MDLTDDLNPDDHVLARSLRPGHNLQPSLRIPGQATPRDILEIRVARNSERADGEGGGGFFCVSYIGVCAGIAKTPTSPAHRFSTLLLDPLRPASPRNPKTSSSYRRSDFRS